MQTINWSGPILGDIAVLCLRAGKYERWSSIISYLLNQQNSIIGTPDMSQINQLFDECILSCHTTPAIVCLLFHTYYYYYYYLSLLLLFIYLFIWFFPFRIWSIIVLMLVLKIQTQWLTKFIVIYH